MIKYPKNLNYFNEIDSEFKAYFLGFLLADGHVRNNTISIKLSTKDADHLKKISYHLLGQDATKIRIAGKNSSFIGNREIEPKDSIELNLTCKEWVLNLSKFCLIPKKSLILEFPNLPESLIHHFIRGYFDGDGCISKRKWQGAIRYSITILSSLEFCKKLSEICKQTGLNLTVSKTPSKIYKAENGGNRKILSFCEWLYKDASIFLDRKYQIYLELLEHTKKIDESRSSQFRGVSFDKTRNKWLAYSCINRKTKNLGRFLTEKEAADAVENFKKT